MLTPVHHQGKLYYVDPLHVHIVTITHCHKDRDGPSCAYTTIRMNRTKDETLIFYLHYYSFVLSENHTERVDTIEVFTENQVIQWGGTDEKE